VNISIALLGCGGWGKNLARNLNELGVLSLIVDPAPQAAELAASLDVEYSDDPECALQSTTINGVVIATPAPTHFAVATAALNAGKAVFVEKPIALSTDQGELLAQKALETGQVLMVGHLLQYHPMFIRLKQMIENGELGNVKYIASSRLNMGMIRTEENVIWSFSPHDISMVLGIAGSLPDKVSAIGAFALGNNDVADIGTIHLSWSNGLRADITSSWLSPQKEQKLVVVGDRAMAVFSDTLPWEEKLTIYRNKVINVDGRPKAIAGVAELIEVPKGEPLKMEMQHFIECVASGASPRTDAMEATRVLAVLQCAEESFACDNAWIATPDIA
jgi:predicted dehydrogenase